MDRETKLIQIIRKIGAPKPPRIKLTGILESPDVDLFSFLFAVNTALCGVLEHLSNSKINIRFITKTNSRNKYGMARICTDTDYRDEVNSIFEQEVKKRFIENLDARPNVRILSLYPFKGDPRVAMHVINTLNADKIEILAVSTASSVISCVIPSEKVFAAKRSLRSAFSFN